MGMYHERIMKIWNCKKNGTSYFCKKMRCGSLCECPSVCKRSFTQLASFHVQKNIQTYNPKRWFRPTTVQALAGNFTAWVIQEKEKFGTKGRANESSVLYGPGHMIGFWYAEYKMPRDRQDLSPWHPWWLGPRMFKRFNLYRRVCINWVVKTYL